MRRAGREVCGISAPVYCSARVMAHLLNAENACSEDKAANGAVARFKHEVFLSFPRIDSHVGSGVALMLVMDRV